MLILMFLALGSAVFYAKAQDQSCDKEKFEKCVEKLGFPNDDSQTSTSNAPFSDTKNISKSIGNFCRIRTNLSECLGGKNESVECMQLLIPTSLFEVPAEAIFDASEFICRQNVLPVILGKFDCAISTLNSSFSACISPSENETDHQQNPRCLFAKQYDDCLRRPLENACGKQIADVMCELYNIPAAALNCTLCESGLGIAPGNAAAAQKVGPPSAVFGLWAIVAAIILLKDF